VKIDHLSPQELLALHASISSRLRTLGVSRSANNPVADYAEWLCAGRLGLTLAGNSTAGFDATDSSGRRYEIKARRRTPDSTPTHLSAIRGLPTQLFDDLIAVIFDEEYVVDRAVLLPFQVVSSLARYRKHVNGSYLYLRDLWKCQDARDITATLRGSLPLSSALM
jgi:hypothetical protein